MEIIDLATSPAPSPAPSPTRRPQKQKITWTAEKYQRLLAATLAAHPGLKLNYNAIAGMFGEGATYDSIETRYRQVKKDAKKLSDEVSSGERPGIAPATPRKRKQQQALLGTPTTTPRKKSTVKEEGGGGSGSRGGGGSRGRGGRKFRPIKLKKECSDDDDEGDSDEDLPEPVLYDDSDDE